MFKYKNVSKYEQKFRAGEGGKKKVYTVKPSKEIELPVEISMGGMELVEAREMKTDKKTKKGEV